MSKAYTLLCPKCGTPMLMLSDGTLTCPRCGYRLKRVTESERWWRRAPDVKRF